MLERLDIWLALATLVLLAYFELRKYLGPIVRPLIRLAAGFFPPAEAEPLDPPSRVRRLPLRRRSIPLQRSDGKLAGSVSVVTNKGNDQVTPSGVGNEPFMPSARDVTPSLPVTSLPNGVTISEVVRISMLLAEGNAPSNVAKKLPGYTPDRYGEFKAKVDQVKAAMAEVEAPPVA